jgi:pimeloyl-ACP methyl ester carboxylesterase
MTFVLVHGSGFTSACWDELIPHLSGEVLPVDLPGRGRHPADLRTVSVADWAASVVADIEEAGLDDVVLVGHSLAGLTLPRIVGLIPERLRRVVFIACAVPPHGVTPRSTVESSVAPGNAERIAALADNGKGNVGSRLPSPDLAAAMFCNDMDPEQTARTIAQMVPEAVSVLFEPVDLSGLENRVPRTWIRLLLDAGLAPEVQDTFIANVGDVEVVDLEAAHMAMISRPKELAEILNRLA